MADQTGISWADATLNFWIGCTKVGPACDHCYAEAYGNRFGVKWGIHELRRKTKHWLAKAMKLERLAIKKLAAGGGAFHCFSNSLSDIMDKEVPIEWLAEAIEVARATSHVTYLFLTKRPQNFVKRARAIAESVQGPYADEIGLRAFWPNNIAIGCTVVTQEEADRDIPWLLKAKAALRPAFAFVSMEPLLGPVDLTQIALRRDGELPNEMSRQFGDYVLPLRGAFTDSPRLDLVITGGESGAHARPVHPSWDRSIRDQCATAGVAFHRKQWGEWMPAGQVMADGGRLITSTGHRHYFPDGLIVYRVGTKAAGRLLDGVLHDAMPVPA